MSGTEIMRDADRRGAGRDGGAMAADAWSRRVSRRFDGHGSHSLRAPFARLRSERGESLVESIVAFAVITVILIAFAAFVSLGSNLTAQTTQLDAAAGSVPATAAGTATVTVDGTTLQSASGGDLTVNVYGNDAGAYRYEG